MRLKKGERNSKKRLFFEKFLFFFAFIGFLSKFSFFDMKNIPK